jgi:F420-dependent oxidoreductase-like protein
MDVCLMIEGQENVTWEQWVALALACQEHGFDALFRSDHYLSFGHPAEYGSLDAWATLAALAPRTSRIRMGTLVSPVTFRHPANLAKTVVTVDHASEGRIELGLGAGWFEDEHRAHGFPFPPHRERLSMLAEQVEIVHRVWDRDEDEVSFQGRHYRLERCHALPKPLQHPHPPLIIGGGSASHRSMGIACRWADEYNVFSTTPAGCRKVRDALDRGCEEAGRDRGEVRLSLMIFILVGVDRRELEARAARLLEARGQSGDPAAWLAGLGPERIAGTPEQVLERLAEYAHAGVRRVMLQDLLHEDLEMVALIGREVIPEAATL